MERTSLCVACQYYGLSPGALSVDPGCQSTNEVDALCMVHRARCTEGYCVLCGHRAAWVSPWPTSVIGTCPPCFQGVFGMAEADILRRQLAFPAERVPISDLEGEGRPL
jgi:hypothetical protein